VRARLGVLAVLALGTVSLAGSATARPVATGISDWPEFGYSPGRQNVGPASTGITATNVGRLRRRQIQLDGTADSSPVYLHHVTVRGKSHDVVFVTTSYGKTEAIDAVSGKVLWRYTPPTYGSYVGTEQITTMAPLASPDRTAVYAGEPDGRIVKLAVADGTVLWSMSITRDPAHEKLSGSINFSRGMVLVATGGYYGDAPPYQGHIVTLSEVNGQIVGVWNSLCSDRHTIIQPATCSSSDSGAWGRSVPVVDPGTGNLLVATGNGPWNGKTDWGDSTLVLSPDATRLLKHWTPKNQDELNTSDQDIGSTAPALLGGGYLVQGGKDGKLRLLSLSHLAGVDGTLGGELQTVPTPGGAELFTAPAVWRGTWVFVSDSNGTAAWVLRGGHLEAAWQNDNAGTSPVVAGGLLYVEGSGGIHVYAPMSGHEVAKLPIGDVHWESPIVGDGRVVATQGDSNNHSTSGVLDIYSLA
jgi:putative pyrroloquinoline-quinone binding quinoprotein